MFVWGWGVGAVIKLLTAVMFLFFSGWLDEIHWTFQTLKAIEDIFIIHGKDLIVFPC